MLFACLVQQTYNAPFLEWLYLSPVCAKKTSMQRSFPGVTVLVAYMRASVDGNASILVLGDPSWSSISQEAAILYATQHGKRCQVTICEDILWYFAYKQITMTIRNSSTKMHETSGIAESFIRVRRLRSKPKECNASMRNEISIRMWRCRKPALLVTLQLQTTSNDIEK